MSEIPDAGALPIGTLADDPTRQASLLARRFNRHTFLCGQSGSGKTYALGVLLEQLLVHTRLPLVVLDPNSDFVHLDEQLPRVPDRDASVLRSRDIRILRSRSVDGANLLVRFTGLPAATKAAIMRLDPVVDRDEYNSLLHADEMMRVDAAREILPRLANSGDEGFRALGTRIENLAVLDWEIWAGGERPATEIIDERPDATVLDLGGFQHPDEPLAVALSVLGDLWNRRAERRPVLIVIDEAHNLCSPDLDSPLGRAVREQIIQIAAEGRKFGLWMLLSTQRPSKIHPNIISQCDNLVLMKMSSPADLAGLGSIFGFAPRDLLDAAPRFMQGEMLLAGGFIDAATIVRVRERVTREGGSDVEVPLRQAER